MSQPPPFSRGETIVTDDTDITVTEERQKLLYLSEGADLGEVVNALNAIGVSPRDLITVLQAIRASGALYADLDVI